MKKYNNKGRLFGLIGVLMLLLTIFTSAQMLNLSSHNENDKINPYIEIENLFISASRGEIKIYSDSAFILVNGVRSGNGTEGNPYVISNWNINTPGEIGIEVKNTKKHFKILNCSFSNHRIGIQFVNVTNGVIYNNTIKDLIGTSNTATGILIENSTNIDITQNFITNISGSSGFDGSNGIDSTGPTTSPTAGNSGENGQDAYGISIHVSNYLNLSLNIISDIISGNGGSGGDGGNAIFEDTMNQGGEGGNGGDGGKVEGIEIYNTNHTVISKNIIYNVISGVGGVGGNGGFGADSFGDWDTADGGAGGNGGGGGSAYGLHLEIGKNSTIYGNYIDMIVGGVGSLPGIGGAGGSRTAEGTGFWIWIGMGGFSGQAGAGGMAIGCILEQIADSKMSYNNVTHIYGGNGSNGVIGGRGGDCLGLENMSPGMGGGTGDAGDGGQAIGIRLIDCVNFNNTNNLLKSITGGSGGNGGLGGPTGDMLQTDVDNWGTIGSIGGDGGSGGHAYGILGENYSFGKCNFNDVNSIAGGDGGKAGNGADGGIASMNGGGGSNGGMSGAAGIAIGIGFYSIMNISTYMNYITSICGGNGGNGGDGGFGGHSWNENAGWAGAGTDGNSGGIGSAIAILSAINITNSNNDISFIYGGSGGNGGNGGNGGSGDITGRNLYGMGLGGGGGDGGNGGISGGAYGIYHVNVNFTLNWENLISNIQTLDGGSGGNGGDGGDAFDGTPFNQGGNGGNGGNSGSSGNSSGIFFESSLNNTNNLNEISQIEVGDIGNFGILGIKGISDLNGTDGVNGTSTSNGIGYGFYLDKTNSTLSYLNNVYVHDNLDTRGVFNKWNSTTIGNYWENYTGLDVAPPFGIGDVSYNLTGSSGSKDWLPIIDSVAPNVTINQPIPLQVIPVGVSVLINVTIGDDSIITNAIAMINSTIPFNLTLTEENSDYWIATWDNATQYPTGDYNITIWVKDWKNNINNTEWVIIQSTDITPPQVVINNPTNGSSFEPPGDLSIPLSVDVSDTYGITSVIAQINASTPFNISLPLFIEPTYQLTWNNYTDLTYPPGDYRITFIAIDTNGNVNNTESVVISVVKDLVGPNIIINSPNNESVYRSPVNIRVFVNDPKGNSPNAGDVIATIYNGTIVPFNLALTNTLLNQWDVVWSNLTTNYYPGNYYINITAYDSSYYHNINKSVGFLNITYEYDTTAPIINFISINDNTTVITTSNYNFSVNIIDENQPQFGDVLFEVSTNSSLFNDAMTSLGGGNWEYVWNNISSYSNGKYIIRAFAIDSAPGAWSNWSLTWEISINIPTDDDDDFASILLDIVIFLTSTAGMITIGVGGGLIVAVIVIIKKRGSYTPSSKDRMRVDEYREVFHKDRKNSS